MLCLEVDLTESPCRSSVAFINYWFHLIKIKYLNLSDQNNRHKSP